MIVSHPTLACYQKEIISIIELLNISFYINFPRSFNTLSIWFHLMTE